MDLLLCMLSRPALADTACYYLIIEIGLNKMHCISVRSFQQMKWPGDTGIYDYCNNAVRALAQKLEVLHSFFCKRIKIIFGCHNK